MPSATFTPRMASSNVLSSRKAVEILGLTVSAIIDMFIRPVNPANRQQKGLYTHYSGVTENRSQGRRLSYSKATPPAPDHPAPRVPSPASPPVSVAPVRLESPRDSADYLDVLDGDLIETFLANHAGRFYCNGCLSDELLVFSANQVRLITRPLRSIPPLPSRQDDLHPVSH